MQNAERRIENEESIIPFLNSSFCILRSAFLAAHRGRIGVRCPGADLEADFLARRAPALEQMDRQTIRDTAGRVQAAAASPFVGFNVTITHTRELHHQK
jgi:hypothetical protein